MVSCQVCWRTMRWHNGQIRRSPNPHPSKVFQDWSNKWEESVAHSILARSLFTPTKAVYMSADQLCPSHFSLAIRRRTIHSECAVRTKPLARRTLRVRVGRGLLFDRLLPRCRRSNILGDTPLWDTHNRVLSFINVPWNIDSNSNNGPRLPKRDRLPSNGAIQTDPAVHIHAHTNSPAPGQSR